MRIGTYMVIMFVTSFGFYLMGYNSIVFSTLIGSIGTDQPIAQNLLNQIAQVFISGTTSGLAVSIIALLGIAGVATFLGSGSNFLSFFVVPLVLMGILIANFVFFPLSFMFDQTLPVLFKYGIFGFLNLWLLLAIIGFVRGDTV